MINETMICLKCSQHIKIHIIQRSNEKWNIDHYCEKCRRGYSEIDRSCRSCGLKFQTFLKRGLLGCEECYDIFRPELNRLLRKYLKNSRWRSNLFDNVTTSKNKEFTDNKSNIFDSGLVKSCRIRFARNIKGFKYLAECSRTEKKRIDEILFSKNSGLILELSRFFGSRKGMNRNSASNISGIDIDDSRMNKMKRIALIPEKAENLYYFPAEQLMLYSGDEDHLRTQQFIQVNGLQNFKKSYSRAIDMQKVIDNLLNLQIHPHFGHQTACPLNSGCGVRISFQLELNKLLGAGEWLSWKKELENAGFVLRGPMGEGSLPLREIQISNNLWKMGVDLISESDKMVVILERLIRKEKLLMQKIGLSDG